MTNARNPDEAFRRIPSAHFFRNFESTYTGISSLLQSQALGFAAQSVWLVVFTVCVSNEALTQGLVNIKPRPMCVCPRCQAQIPSFQTLAQGYN